MRNGPGRTTSEQANAALRSVHRYPGVLPGSRYVSVAPADIRPDNPRIARFPAGRPMQSACYTRAGALSCVTCTNPHARALPRSADRSRCLCATGSSGALSVSRARLWQVTHERAPWLWCSRPIASGDRLEPGRSWDYRRISAGAPETYRSGQDSRVAVALTAELHFAVPRSCGRTMRHRQVLFTALGSFHVGPAQA